MKISKTKLIFCIGLQQTLGFPYCGRSFYFQYLAIVVLPYDAALA